MYVHFGAIFIASCVVSNRESQFDVWRGSDDQKS